MTLLIVLLVLAWTVVLVPWLLRQRAERGSAGSVRDSLKRLSVLHGPAPSLASRSTPVPLALAHSTATMAKARARRNRKRRRDVFMGLLASSIGSAGLGLFVPQLWVLHGLVDVVLVGYIALLLRMRHGSIRPVRTMPVRESREYAYVYSRD